MGPWDTIGLGHNGTSHDSTAGHNETLGHIQSGTQPYREEQWNSETHLYQNATEQPQTEACMGCVNVSTVTDFLLKLAFLVNSVHAAKVLFFCLVFFILLKVTLSDGRESNPTGLHSVEVRALGSIYSPWG